MSLNYHQSQRKAEQSDNMWSSYSDLFMVLSLIFLLLYVTSSLRNGTDGIQRQIELHRMTLQNEDLKEQARVYNTLKDEYLETKATDDELETYSNLMDKLELLQEENRQEKESLRAAANENEQKEIALNQYQQVVRNIINANLLAKAGIKRRDETITQKTETIRTTQATLAERERTLKDTRTNLAKAETTIKQSQADLEKKSKTIAKLESAVEVRKKAIEKNNKRIQQIESDLSQKINELKKSQKSKQLTETKLNQQIQELTQNSEAKVKALSERNEKYETQLAKANVQLASVNEELESVSKNLEQSENAKAQLKNELRDATEQYKSQMAAAKSEFDQQMADAEQKFKSDLDKQKLSASEKAAKLKEFEADAKAKEKELKGKLAELGKKVSESEKQLAEAKEDGQKFKEYVASLEKTNNELANDLAASKNIINNKKQIAKDIKEAFKKAGMDIDVDGKTGDVILSFGDEYFDTGRADLKPNMLKTLEKFMPIYATSLFKNESIAKNIENVEIVGYSSPTYRGKYIDPKSLSQKDRAAVNYNLDLSYQRARSIFNHIFDTNKMEYKNQKKLLPLVKVTGRSFLADGVKGKDLKAGMSHKEYCKKYNCKKEQKVIIKFNLKN